MTGTARAPHASIADVARLAGVSPTTVSHVISGRRPVSERTAAAVAQAMQELGYVPNRAARSLRHGMSQTLGLLVPDISNPYFAELARGAEDAVEARGFNLLLCNTAFDPEREARYLDVLRGRGVDGMLYAAGAPPSSERLAEVARTFRLVVVDEELAGVPVQTVVSDNERGGRLAGEHLRELGHRAVLEIAGPPGLTSSPLRARGFAAAFDSDPRDSRDPRDARDPRDPRHPRIERVDGDYRAESATAAVRAALDAGPRWFTAIFAANDLMALAAIEVLAQHGLRVPEDVSVVGYDDTVYAALVRPALTTVRQPVYRMGWVAAERLMGALNGDEGEDSKVVLDVELVVRQTTAPPREVEVPR